MIPRFDDIPPDFGYGLATQRANAARLMTIKNGLYSINTKLLDGVDGGATGISVLRNGKILGGGSLLYHFGSYDCSDGKWKETTMAARPDVRRALYDMIKLGAIRANFSNRCR
jgi:hypothetical protein